jgi:hypothetical protein
LSRTKQIVGGLAFFGLAAMVLLTLILDPFELLGESQEPPLLVTAVLLALAGAHHLCDRPS